MKLADENERLKQQIHIPQEDYKHAVSTSSKPTADFGSGMEKSLSLAIKIECTLSLIDKDDSLHDDHDLASLEAIDSP